jgi:predicted aldo/keto reductase-like oxidoreductase
VYQRDYSGAKKELDETFKLLKTDYIDIVQLHGIKDQKDKKCLGKRGSLQVLKEAKQAGMIGHIGLTGHYDPIILMEFMDEYEFATVLVALNPAVPQFLNVVKKAWSQGMGVISMKVMARGVLPLAFPPEALLQWALIRSDVAIVGCSTETDVEQNVLAASDFSAYTDIEFEMSKDLHAKSAFFAKGFEGQKWPSTYQPNSPTLQYE